MKMIRIKGFRNAKNWSQDQTQAFIENPKKKLEPGLKVSFKIKNWPTMNFPNHNWQF
jgi:cytochrome c2